MELKDSFTKQPSNIFGLSAIFSRKNIVEAVKDPQATRFFSILEECGVCSEDLHTMSMCELFEATYSLHLRNKVRYEYMYKNEVLKKLFLGTHSPNTSVLLNEVRVDNTVADLALINGVSHAIEIKTERDSLSRLENQISTYRQVFEKVSVFTARKHFEGIGRIVPSGVGIYVFNNRNSFSVFREPEIDTTDLDLSKIISLLRKSELVWIMRFLKISLPDLKKVCAVQIMRDKIAKIDPMVVHGLAMAAIKENRNQNWFSDVSKGCPRSLLQVVLKQFSNHLKASAFISTLDRIKESDTGKCTLPIFAGSNSNSSLFVS